MRIGIVGCNDVSLCFGIKLVNSIDDIIYYDDNDDILNNLKNNIYITNEPYLQDSLLLASNIKTTSSILELIDKTDIIFYFIEHTKNIDETYDTNSLFKITDEYLMASNNNIVVYDKHFVITTDLNIGDCEKNKIKLEPYNVHIGFLPLSFKKGKILNMMSKLDYLILGYNNQYTSEKVVRIFNRINRNMIKYYTMTLNSAELAKIVLNTFIGLKNTFINNITNLVDELKLIHEKELIIRAISDCPEMSNVSFKSKKTHYPDLKINDINIFNSLIENYNISNHISSSIIPSNEYTLNRLKEKLSKINEDNSKPFLFEEINNSDFEIEIITYLLNLGHNVVILDHNFISDKLKKLSIEFNGKLKFYKNTFNLPSININMLI